LRPAKRKIARTLNRGETISREELSVALHMHAAAVALLMRAASGAAHNHYGVVADFD
jgi:hypothetical protein